MNASEVMKRLEDIASHDPKDLEGMARFGINVDKAWVISIPKLRKLAAEIGRDHALAQEVWSSGIHEAKILAAFIDDPKQVTEKQMEEWALDFDSWDVTDMVCGNLFDHSAFAVQKAVEWSTREEEFVKRAAFVLMAALAVHNKSMSDDQFLEFLEIIKKEAGDSRNFVRKSINWALRQIAKSRNKALYSAAINTANEIMIQAQDDKSGWNVAESKAARWIARDALRELEKGYIRKRF